MKIIKIIKWKTIRAWRGFKDRVKIKIEDLELQKVNAIKQVVTGWEMPIGAEYEKSTFYALLKLEIAILDFKLSILKTLEF